MRNIMYCAHLFIQLDIIHCFHLLYSIMLYEVDLTPHRADVMLALSFLVSYREREL